jgi:beta-glucanase (GH16 family)
MHKSLVLAAMLAWIVGGSALAADAPSRAAWKLSFDDEFDGTTLDLSKWTPADPWGWERNQELQAYVTNAFEVKDGVLRVRAERKAARYAGKERACTLGMMTTYQKFSQRYGRFEIRCRIPSGKGLWPAFWMLPEPLGWPPEIDVLEVLGHEPDKIYLTHHFRDSARKHKSHGGSWKGPDFSKDFHTFAVEWTPEHLIWFVDEVERYRSEDSIPTGKMYLLVNLAIGGDWPGAPGAATQFPNALEVDYVRIYEKVQ